MRAKTSMTLNDFFTHARPINLKRPKADNEDIDMVSCDKILRYLDEEVERHKEEEGMQTKPWDRGFHNGSMTEAIILRNAVRGMMIHEKH